MTGMFLYCATLTPFAVIITRGPLGAVLLWGYFFCELIKRVKERRFSLNKNVVVNSIKKRRSIGVKPRCRHYRREHRHLDRPPELEPAEETAPPWVHSSVR